MSTGRSSWRSLASNVTSSVKNIAKGAYEGGYDKVSARVANWRGSEAETWQQWRERRREESRGTEKLSLFPGHAVRRYDSQSNRPNGFQVELFVDGFASSLRPPELATRSQRAFMRLAKGFAALPNLPEAIAPGGSLLPDDRDSLYSESSDSIDISGLPPPPSEMTDEGEAEALRHHATRHHLATQRSTPDLSSKNSPDFTKSSRPSSLYNSANSSHESFNPLGNSGNISHDQLARLHANLDARLQPFWSSILSNRVVRLSVYATSHSGHERPTDEMVIESSQNESFGAKPEPLGIQDLVTSPQGYFAHKFVFSFEQLCTHPAALAIAFGDTSQEHHFVIKADLLPIVANQEGPSENRSPGQTMGDTSAYQDGTAAPNLAISSSEFTPPHVSTQMVVPLTNSRVRLISDIDDTVKKTDVLTGSKSIFQNVFTKPLEELVVPGMGAWYYALYDRGVKFHYVSNSPFELLTVLRDFFVVANLPKGSIKLKFYGGKNIFTGLWQAAGERKRTGVLEILDQFDDSQFFLVGDSGEQDLELYAALASERPHQILGIFIRDVSSGLLPGENEPDMAARYIPRPRTPNLPPPTHRRSETMRAGRPTPPNTPPSTTSPPYKVRLRRSDTMPVSPSSSRSSVASFEPYTEALTNEPQSFIDVDPMPRSRPSTLDSATNRTITQSRNSSGLPLPGSYFTSNQTHPSSSSTVSTPSTPRTDAYGNQRQLVGVEKRREELRLRERAARDIIPPHIPLKIFKDPAECTEAMQILDQLEAQ